MNYTLRRKFVYDFHFFLENELVSQEGKLGLRIACGGNNMDTLKLTIIYYSTGYHDVEQLWECEEDNFYFNDEIKEYYGLGEEEIEEE